MPEAAVHWLSTLVIAVAGGAMDTVIAAGSATGTITTARALACALAIGTIGTMGTIGTIVTKTGVLRDGPVIRSVRLRCEICLGFQS